MSERLREMTALDVIRMFDPGACVMAGVTAYQTSSGEYIDSEHHTFDSFEELVTFMEAFRSELEDDVTALITSLQVG